MNCGAAFYIPECKDPGHIGFEMAVDLNVTMLIEADPRCGRVQTVGIGPSARGHQHMGGGDDNDRKGIPRDGDVSRSTRMPSCRLNALTFVPVRIRIPSSSRMRRISAAISSSSFVQELVGCFR